MGQCLNGFIAFFTKKTKGLPHVGQYATYAAGLALAAEKHDLDAQFRFSRRSDGLYPAKLADEPHLPDARRRPAQPRLVLYPAAVGGDAGTADCRPLLRPHLEAALGRPPSAVSALRHADCGHCDDFDAELGQLRLRLCVAGGFVVRRADDCAVGRVVKYGDAAV